MFINHHVFLLVNSIKLFEITRYLGMKIHLLTEEEERIGKAIVNAAFKVHVGLGPGLLEKIYETCLCHELKKAGLFVERQVCIPLHYDEFEEGLRLDLLVERKIIVEIKAVDIVNSIWIAQILSQLKMTNLQLGYLINFNVPVIKDGIKRIIL